MTEEIRDSLPQLPPEPHRGSAHEELDEWHERLEREHNGGPRVFDDGTLNDSAVHERVRREPRAGGGAVDDDSDDAADDPSGLQPWEGSRSFQEHEGSNEDRG
ncbi:MAG: hypothetical protein HZY73_06465 [Micropruina sp.]|nr:MAG: hypothetical protein HZY73_06465 [Micropruina sp.]